MGPLLFAFRIFLIMRLLSIPVVYFEAKSGWPLPKPNANYPVLSTVLEGYNYIHGHRTNPPVLSSGLPVK